jgi:hypothetical protein
LNEAPRPSSTTASTGYLRAQASSAKDVAATAQRSQLMVDASTIPGASATMAASQGRRRTVRAAAQTVTASSRAMRIALSEK